MNRSMAAVIVIILYMVCLPVYQGYGKGIGKAPNVILIVVDTLAAGHLGFMGCERDTSPFIDELASKSVIFDRAYTPRPKTLPSFTSLLSGIHPIRHRVLENGVNLPKDLHFLTEDLQESGYTTWGMASAKVIGAQYGFDRGFDYYANIPPIPHNAPEMLERVDRLINNRPMLGEPMFGDIKGPLFMMVHFYDVHTPFTPESEYLEKISTADYCGPVDGSYDVCKLYNEGEIDFSDADLQRIRDLYDAEIRQLDSELEKMFGMLDDAGILENSVIIFTADHGENLGEHEYITHGPPYEQGLHIPLFIHFPNDRFGGSRIGTKVENTDIFPTILVLAGVKPPEGIDGMSMVPLFEKIWHEEYVERDSLFAIGDTSGGGRVCSVFDGKYRLIFDGGGIDKNMLFDIETDPHESCDLSDSRIDVVRRLSGEVGDKVGNSVSGQEVVPDAETLEMLRSLGYI